MLLRLYVPEQFVDIVKVAPVPLPLVLVCEIFVNVEAPLAVPLILAVLTPDAAMPVADAAIAPDTGELPDGDEAVTLPVKS